MPRRSCFRIAVALMVLPAPLLSAQSQDSAFALVRHLVESDTNRFSRLMEGQALWRSGFWAIDGEYEGPTGVFYKATGYWAFVLSTGVVESGKPNAVLALYIEPYSGGQSRWLGAALTCHVPLSPMTHESARCAVSEGATALLDLNFMVDPGVFFRFQDVTVTLTEPEEKDPVNRWTSRSKSRGRFHLIRADSTASWK